MSSLAADFRYAFRTLRNSPAFSLAALLTLGLGIGLNATVFSAVYGVLLRPFDLPHPGHLYSVGQNMEKRGGMQRDYTGRAVFSGWRARNRCFSGLALYGASSVDLSGIDPPEHVDGATISHEFFSVLGVRLLLGRGFFSEEETRGKGSVAILSYGLWARRFGRDPKLVGKVILANGVPLTVVGILPRQFRSPVRTSAEIWTPIALDPTAQDWGIPYMGAIGRLAASVAPAAAQAEMSRVEASLVADHPADLRDIGVTVTPLLDSIVGSIRKPLLLLLGASTLVLLVTCFNIANLSLSRAATRHSELAIRLALGAGRGQLTRTFVAESLLLAAGGAALGLILGALYLAVLRGLAPPQTPRLDSVRFDGAVVVINLAVSLVLGLATGLLPAAWSWGRRPFAALREASGVTSGRPTLLSRGALVVAEIAACVVLLVGAGALGRSLAALARVDPGFRTERMVVGRLTVTSGHSDDREVSDFAVQLEQRLQARREIAAVGVIYPQPLADRTSSPTSFSLEGQEPAAEQRQAAIWRWVTPGYFKAFGVRLVAGRLLDASDTAEAPRVALVNESFVRRFLAGREPVGRRYRSEMADGREPPWRHIVGVVSDLRGTSLDRPPEPELYLPLAQDPPQYLTVAARASGSPSAALAALQAVVRQIRPGQVLARPETLEEAIDRALSPQRFAAGLIGAFAGVTLLLAAVGIFGVTSLAVSQRQRELALRQALGAPPSAITALVLRWSGLLIFAGGVAGVVGWTAASKVATSLLYEVKPMDGLSIAAALGVLAIAAFAATLLPALRASRADLARVLKSGT
jgi:putative ABC transport system permease protein